MKCTYIFIVFHIVFLHSSIKFTESAYVFFTTIQEWGVQNKLVTSFYIRSYCNRENIVQERRFIFYWSSIKIFQVCFFFLSLKVTICKV